MLKKIKSVRWIFRRIQGISLTLNLHSSSTHLLLKCSEILHFSSVEISKLNDYLQYFPDNILFYYFIFRWFLLGNGSHGSAMMTLIICLFQHRFSRWSLGSPDFSLNTTSRKKPWQWRSLGSWLTVASECIHFAIFAFENIHEHGKKSSRQRSLWWEVGVSCTSSFSFHLRVSVFCSSCGCVLIFSLLLRKLFLILSS